MAWPRDNTAARPVGARDLDRKVTFKRRPEEDDEAGNERGAYVALATTKAAYQPMSSAVRSNFGYAEDQLTGWLTIREQSRLQDLSIADRVDFDGQSFAIDSVPVKDRSGWRRLRISRKMG